MVHKLYPVDKVNQDGPGHSDLDRHTGHFFVTIACFITPFFFFFRCMLVVCRIVFKKKKKKVFWQCAYVIIKMTSPATDLIFDDRNTVFRDYDFQNTDAVIHEQNNT